MTFESVATGDFKAPLKEAAEYHHAAFGNGKLCLFSRKYVDQKLYNWGHRIHYAGGYAIAYDPTSKKFDDVVEVPALDAFYSDLENAEEQIFTLAGTIYLLLTTAFGAEGGFIALHKWTGTQWERVASFQDAASIKAAQGSESDENKAHLYWAVADGDHDGEKFILSATGGAQIQAHALKITPGGATITPFAVINDDVNRMRGRPIGGFLAGGELYVSVGVQGCGFRWENGRLYTIDLATKEADEKMIDGDSSTFPTFCFSGPYLKTLSKKGEWLTVGGSTQVGMCGSDFNAEIWHLTGAATGGSIEWKKDDVSLPTGVPKEDFNAAYDEASGVLYVVGGEAVHIKEI